MCTLGKRLHLHVCYSTSLQATGKIRHIHGGVGKAVGAHSTPLPLSSIKIHRVKARPDRSISIGESS